MRSDFNKFIPNLIKIKNKKTDEIKVFKTKSELIEFIRAYVKNKDERFEKDILTLQKEKLINKYLKDWFFIF